MARRIALLGLGTLLAASAALGGCAAQPPDVGDPGRVLDAGALVADVLLAYTEDGQTRTCGDGIPVCGAGEPEPCGPEAVLGTPDGMRHTLEPSGTIEIGFRCAVVTERGGMSTPDLKIWADVPDGAAAIVELSDDGATFEPWIELRDTDQELDLAFVGRTSTRFLRISDRGTGGIAIDAVEALR